MTAHAPPHNFSAGPGALPPDVLRQAQQAIAGVPEAGGLSVLGISHRSAWFRQILDEAEALLRQLLEVPDDYRVLFLQGGSSLQFTMIPMAMLGDGCADYLVTGYWGGKAVEDARRLGQVCVVWDGAPDYSRLPAEGEVDYTTDARYLHFVSNETVEGLQFSGLPGLPGVPRVCDMSSDFLSRPARVADFALIYAHAQKNLGPAGVTVVVVDDEVVRKAPPAPSMLDYRTHVQHRSNYNTPPVFAIYVVLLVLRWLRDQGGVAGIAVRNQAKATALYECLDQSDGFYRPHVAAPWRSRMNVAFHLAQPALQQAWLAQAEQHGLHGLSGHRSLGGLRASLYNAVSLQAVEALTDFLRDFARRYG